MIFACEFSQRTQEKHFSAFEKIQESAPPPSGRPVSRPARRRRPQSQSTFCFTKKKKEISRRERASAEWPSSLAASAPPPSAKSKTRARPAASPVAAKRPHGLKAQLFTWAQGLEVKGLEVL